jgi:hypothetical protein
MELLDVVGRDDVPDEDEGENCHPYRRTGTLHMKLCSSQVCEKLYGQTLIYVQHNII